MHQHVGCGQHLRAEHIWSDDDLVLAYANMEISGYSIRWAQRPDGERDQPAWMQLIAADAGGARQIASRDAIGAISRAR